MPALPHDVMEKVGSYLTRLQLHLSVTDWTTSAVRFGPSDWDIATQLTEQALEEFSNRKGFAPQLRTVEARYSWTVILHCHHHDLAATVRLGSIAQIWVKPMLALAQRNISVNTSGADWHKSPLIEKIYMDIELLQFMKARPFSAPIHLERSLQLSDSLDKVCHCSCHCIAMSLLQCIHLQPFP